MSSAAPASGTLPVAAPPVGPRWHHRDFAIRLARTMGRPESAIRSVLAAYTDAQYQTRAPKWWAQQILDRSAGAQ